MVTVVTDDERQARMESRFIDYVELECRKHAGTVRGELVEDGVTDDGRLFY